MTTNSASSLAQNDLISIHLTHTHTHTRVQYIIKLNVFSSRRTPLVETRSPDAPAAPAEVEGESWTQDINKESVHDWK